MNFGLPVKRCVLESLMSRRGYSSVYMHLRVTDSLNVKSFEITIQPAILKQFKESKSNQKFVI